MKEFFNEHPLTIFSVTAFVALMVAWSFSQPLLGVVIPVGLIIVGMILNNQKKKRVLQQNLNRMIQVAQQFIDEAHKNKTLPTITSTLFLEKDERAIFEEETTLFETRAVRNYGGGGVRIRVAKGISVGGYRGQAESSQQWRPLDHGTVTLTNKRVIFNGGKDTRTIPLSKVLNISNSPTTLYIDIDGRVKSIAFKVSNSLVWSSAINVIRNFDDPFSFGDSTLDINFKSTI